MEDSSENMMLSWEDFIYIVDLFMSDPRKHLALLGGEPSLHPHFVDFILYLNARNFHTTVFTCGIMSPKKLEEAASSLNDIPEEKYTFVCNLNKPDMSSDAETKRIEAFLTQFGPRVTLSFNIFHLDFEMDYLFDYIERFNLRRHLRLGLAAPIPGENNKYIEPDSFSAMAERLCSYLPMFIEHNVSVGFDCGFPLCVFTDEQLGALLRHSKGGGAKMIKFGCNPALDIGPDMSVWSCFPLSRYHKRSLYEFNSITEVYDYYKEFHQDVRKTKAGIYPECEECMYRENNQCAGGCVAHILNKQEAMIHAKTARKTEKTV
jgi:radical SAM protein with 4Fe4S-binding SPASM domain